MCLLYVVQYVICPLAAVSIFIIVFVLFINKKQQRLIVANVTISLCCTILLYKVFADGQWNIFDLHFYNEIRIFFTSIPQP